MVSRSACSRACGIKDCASSAISSRCRHTRTQTSVQADSLESGDEDDRDGEQGEDHNGDPELHRLTEGDDADEHLDDEHRKRLRRELPSQLLEEDEPHKDGEAEGVIHARRALKRRERDGDCLLRLLGGVVVPDG